jgi:hypothetical protein
MTPELKNACEIVFQEHKTFSQSITWKKDAFHGRISIGLREMAKETLVSKNIIFFPNTAKKTITFLNPAVVAAASFEDAVEMAKNNEVAVLSGKYAQPVYDKVATPVMISQPVTQTHRLIKVVGESDTIIADEKWYLKPFLFYVVWPLTAAALGAAMAWLMSEWIEMMWRR